MGASPLSSPFHSATQSTRVSKKMSVTQTYFLAHKARGKLASEAARPDHNLRLLVGHANLLDSLMVDLAEAERDQEAWFNQSIKKSSTPKKTEERHIQWADSIAESPEEEDWEADSSDSDSDSDDEDIEMANAVPLRRVPSVTVVPPSPKMHTVEIEEDDFEEDDDEEEDFAALTLTRSPSHSASPPELAHDSDSSEDESMPPSPPFASIPSFSDKQGRKVTTAMYYDSKQDDLEDQKADFYQEGYYLPPRNPARLVSAVSVY
jgi:hypothetical protein